MNLEQEINLALEKLDATYTELMKEHNATPRIATLQLLREIKFMKFNGKYYCKNKKNEWVFFKTINATVTEFLATVSNLRPKFETKELNAIAKWTSLLKDELVVELELDNNICVFKNGYIDLRDETTVLHKISQDVISKLPIEVIPYDYNINLIMTEEYSIMIKLLNWCAKGDKNELWTILALMGGVLTGYQFEYFFNLYGVEGSGKSTLLDLISQLVTYDKLATTPFQFLTKNNFGLIPLINKTLLINNETSSNLIDSEVLKQLTTKGIDWNIELKGINEPYITKLPVNVVLNSNQALKFKEYGGIDRRFVPIYFPYKQDHKGENFEALDYITEFSKVKNVDGNQKFKNQAVECLIPNMIEGLKYFKKLWKPGDKWPIQSSYFADITKTVKKLNNSPLQFVEDTEFLYEMICLDKGWLQTDRGIYYIDKKDLYKQYKDYCLTINAYQVKETQFFLELEQIFKNKGMDCDRNRNVKQYDGKGKRCFTVIANNDTVASIKNEFEGNAMETSDIIERF